MLTIRDATTADAQALLDIYRYYVEKTAITFEWDTPTVEEFRARMGRTMERYPYLVALADGAVAGYAYAGPFVGRKAYDWAAETTIYLDPTLRHQGLGRRLYGALEAALGRMHIQNLYACIGYPQKEDAYLTRNSAQFHAHLGYHLAGTFSSCGYKFGRWYDMVWMEKHLGEPPPTPEPVIAYRKIRLAGWEPGADLHQS